jgi:hypothetical protein
MNPSPIALARGPANPRQKKGFKIAGVKDRYQEELLILGGQFHQMVSSKDASGGFVLMIPSGSKGPTGPPLKFRPGSQAGKKSIQEPK